MWNLLQRKSQITSRFQDNLEKISLEVLTLKNLFSHDIYWSYQITNNRFIRNVKSNDGFKLYYILSFNGEIYNYKIKNRIREFRFSFNSMSDSKFY